MTGTDARDRRILAAGFALAAIALLAGGSFAGLLWQASFDARALVVDDYLLRIGRFTVWQALLSTALSVLPAILVALAFSRNPAFPFRSTLLRLFALPLALPAIVVTLGVLALFGRAGIAGDLWAALGLGQWPGIYGLSGILIAHVFFNLPLSTRLFLAALDTVPADSHRLAAQLGMGAGATFRFVEWPAMRRALPGIAGLVFMLCVTSFTVVLVLGGGPAATTLEVAIYQALRFDFDPSRAVLLTAAQVVLTAGIFLLFTKMGMPDGNGLATLPVARRRYLRRTDAMKLLDLSSIGLASLFVIGPLAAIVWSGLGADLGRLARDAAVWQAMLTSLALALPAAMLSIVLSLALTSGRRALEARRRKATAGALEWLSGNGAALVLVIPPIVIGAGWFILLNRVADVFAIAPAMVIGVNAVMATPFVMRVLRPAYDAADLRHARLAAMLGIGGWDRWRIIDWPALRRPLGAGFAFAAALSLGDLGVIALFGSDAVQTLPYLLLARMSSYRTADAAGLALILGTLCLALVTLAERAGEERA